MRCLITLPGDLRSFLRIGVLTLFALALAGRPLSVTAGLPEKIQAVINGPNYQQANWGLLFVDLQTGETVYELNADKLFAPASVTKLYSVAAALDAFGAAHRFETSIYRRGEVDSAGVLHGNLILLASGDLTFGGRTDAEGHIVFKNTDHTYANGGTSAELTAPDPLAGIKDLARQVAEAGIRRVPGEVLVDDRLFEKAEGTGSGPSRVTPILVNDNLIDFTITPGVTGTPATVKWRPETSAIRVDAFVDTVTNETNVEITDAGIGRLIVRGRITANANPLVRVHEVDDAASFARSLLIEALRRQGVVVEASPLQLNRPDLLPPANAYRPESRVATFRSPPFSEEARLILKVSHNLHASTLPLLLAARNHQWRLAEGLHWQREFLLRAGVAANTISFGGGAGGSRSDYTTPRATVQLLRYMSTRKDFPVYEDGLPVLGEDGTLARAVDSESPARGKVRAKTGTLYFENTLNNRELLVSKALAGYLTTAKGRRLAFTMFVNGTHLPDATETKREGRTLGKLCEIVYGEL